MSRLMPIAASAALLAGLLLGCGGDDDDGSADGGGGKTALSKDEYIEQGDQICAQGTADIAQEALEKYGTAQPTLEEVSGFAREVVAPTLQEQVDELRALSPPKGEGATVDEIYDAVEDGIRKLEKNPDLLTEPAAGGAFNGANELAQDYGFIQCGSS